VYVSGKNIREQERKTLLAGSEEFIPDILEIWMLKPAGNSFEGTDY